METESMLIWGMVFGSIGLGFSLYGKKQKAIVPLVVGLALFIFPYFVHDLMMMFAVGIGLIVLPYFIKI
jgi:predicted membrane protein